MMANDQRLKQASRITFLGTLINFSILTIQLLFITPLLIRSVGTKVNGAWVASGDLLLWLQAFDFGLTNYAIQKMSVAHAQKNVRELSSWFSSTFILLLVLAATIVLVGPLFVDLVYAPFKLNNAAENDLKVAFLWGLWAVALTIVSYAFTGLGRALHAPLITMVSVIGGSLLGVGVTWWALLNGAGVRSVAYGMFVRAALGCLGGVVAFIVFKRGQLVNLGLPQRQHLKEGLAVMPYSGLGALGYAVSNQSDNFLVGALFGPHIATQFNTTRRAADVAKSVIETLGAANFAGFAHIFARDGAVGSQLTYRRLLSLHSLLSLSLGGCFLIFNQWFMDMWVGRDFYMGGNINTLITLQLFVTTRSYLHNTLNRAIYPPKFAFSLLLFEAVVKISLVLMTARYFGVAGMLLVGISIASISLIVISARNAAQLIFRDYEWLLIVCILIGIGILRGISVWLALIVLVSLLILIYRRYHYMTVREVA